MKAIIRKPCNLHNRGGKRSLKNIKYLVFHWTGNYTDSAWANATYFTRALKYPASAHYFCDAKEIYHSVDDDKIAYSVGATRLLDPGYKYHKQGGKLYGKCTNANSISIEMCVTKGKISAETQKTAYELGRYLALKYGIDDAHIVRHFDVCAKMCPMPMLEDPTGRKAWMDFKYKMGCNNAADKYTSVPTETEIPKLPKRGYFVKGDRTKQVGILQAFLKLKGYYKGAIDRIYGPKTAQAVSDFERDHGLEVDGEWGPMCQKVAFYS